MVVPLAVFIKYFKNILNNKIYYRGLDIEKNVISEAKKKFKKEKRAKFLNIKKGKLKKKATIII